MIDAGDDPVELFIIDAVKKNQQVYTNVLVLLKKAKTLAALLIKGTNLWMIFVRKFVPFIIKSLKFNIDK